jgi:superfamily I DNA/RNA helicase
LTSEQQAVVAHNRGPAVVFAVAGAGKTTALVLRVARLVEEEVFPPQAILATSFNRAANQEIRSALAQWPACAAVQVQTLHALGYSTVRQAMRRGLLPHVRKDALDGIETADRRLLQLAIDKAHTARLPLAGHLDGLDREAFLGYVGGCKGRLAYPDRGQAPLPRKVKGWVQSAPAPAATPWYRELYALYEGVRLRHGLLTFDDLVTTAWEALVSDQALRGEVQGRFQCVLVDEYQDVTPAQAAVVDLIAAPHRNLMVIGDDDQTIYEWRGASAHHLLSFRRRYRAAHYPLSENFRCPAGPVALANQVIRHNRARQPKTLNLTRGFGGAAAIHRCGDEQSMGEALAAALVDAAGQGWKPGEMAVLVRVYAQTPPLVAAIQRAGLPVRVVGAGEAAGPQAQGGRAGAAVTVTSIYRAKGLEWPIVCLPHCNAGFLPLVRAGQVAAENIEEERRLLYVALTRTSHALHLYALAGLPLSPFLEEAQASQILSAVAEIQAALAQNPAQWRVGDYTALGVNAMQLGFHSYFARWWDAPPELRRRVAEAILGFYAAAGARKATRSLGIGKAEVAVWRHISGPDRGRQPPPIPLELAAFLEQNRGR